MFKIIPILFLLIPSTSLAGQATSSFGVGIIITGEANPNATDAGQPAATPQTQATHAEQDWLASCATRYRSFDPASGTYLGFDGLRHPCQ